MAFFYHGVFQGGYLEHYTMEKLKVKQVKYIGVSNISQIGLLELRGMIISDNCRFLTKMVACVVPFWHGSFGTVLGDIENQQISSSY